MKNNVEVVIIGGGIIGCATAYYQNLWPTLSEELEVDCEYHQDGNLRLGKTEEHAKILTRLADNARSVGLDVRMIDGDEVRRINPYLSEEVTVASWCPTDGHANPLTTTLGYYKMARRLGVRFITGEKVTELRVIKGKIRQVITENNIYEGENVLVAAGLDSRPILTSVGIDVPMTNSLLEALVTEAEPPMFNQMLGTAEADFYGHQTKHGSFVFGGSSGMERYNKDNGTPITNSKTASCICRGIMKYFPNLANAKIVRTWAGWMLPQMGFQPLEKWMRYRDYMWHVPLMVMDLVLLRQLANSWRS